MKNKNQIYVPLLASAILIMILIAKAIDVSLLTRENEYVGIIILEVMIFAFPCIIFTRLFPQKSGNTLKISLFGADKLFLAFTASVLLISGSLLYVFLINGINGTDSVFTLYDVFTAKKTDAFSGNLFLILAYALIPALESFAMMTYCELIDSRMVLSESAAAAIAEACVAEGVSAARYAANAAEKASTFSSTVAGTVSVS